MKDSEKSLSKNFKGVLLLNWKTGSMRVLKGKNKVNSTPYEIPVKIDITVNLPREADITAKGNITIPEKKVSEMIIESLEEEGE